MKFLKWMKRWSFLLLLCAVLLVGEAALRHYDPVKYLKPVWRDDFELLQLAHPEEVWDKVFYGSSAVTASYLEGYGGSGYLNAGIDYGTVKDLWELLDKGYITVGSDLVLGLNELSFLDSLPTNPTYVWHRAWYEPYVYFQRDRLLKIVTDGIDNLSNGQPFVTIDHSDQQRQVYHGHLTGAELADGLERVKEKFGYMSPAECVKNFAALDKLADYCREHGVRLRAVWMPRNSKVELYPAAQSVIEAADARLEALGIETLDLLHEIPDEYFYDTGHMDYETGAPYFTETIEPWLKEEG